MTDDLVNQQQKAPHGWADTDTAHLIKLVVEGELKARIEKLEAELHLMKTSGIIEVAVRNPNVMEYMRHWEGRAEAAEAALEKQLKIAAAYEENEGDAPSRVSRFIYEMTGDPDA